MTLAVSADQMLFLHGSPLHTPSWSVSFQQHSCPAEAAAKLQTFSSTLPQMSRASAKSSQTEKPAFVFIDESAKSSKDKRRQIRSQAKRYAIAERSKRPREIRFVNIQGSKDNQPHGDDDLNDTTEKRNEDGKIPGIQARRKPLIFPDLPKKGYEVVRVNYGFDVFLLSGLASVHIGKGASLQLEDSKLGEWLAGFREPSYLDFVPAYYNTSQLLQSTVNCTMAQYRRAMCPESGVTEATVFKLYGKALQELQTALNDDERRLESDVLLATAVLQLFELLQNETSGRWSYHTLGLMHLLQMREPSNFSQIEFSLLACQLGPLVNECFVRQIDCFLEDPKWWDMILQLQRQSTFVTDMLNCQIKLPRFIRIAKDYVLNEGCCGPIQRIRALEEMHGIKEFSYRWEEDLAEYRDAQESVLNLHELPCAVWALQINLNRIMVSMDPLADDAQILEEETQELSEKVMDWWNKSSLLEGERQDRLFTFPIPSAQIAMATKFEWQSAVDNRTGYVDRERGSVDRRVFEKYVQLIKSKAPTRKVRFVLK